MNRRTFFAALAGLIGMPKIAPVAGDELFQESSGDKSIGIDIPYGRVTEWEVYFAGGNKIYRFSNGKLEEATCP